MQRAEMQSAQREIHNVRTGQRMRFLVTGEESGGALLRTESVHPPTGVAEPTHVHPRQESSTEVVSGRLCFVVAGEERRLGPGDALTIPAGVPHHFVNDGDEEAVTLNEFRPALAIEDFFRTYFALADRGELDEHGRPSLLRYALIGPRFADEIRVVSPPWPVQRVAFAALAPIARLRGMT